jgi:precorrin-2 dehydrogenase/sirohydrochlorin ferrochelatase
MSYFPAFMDINHKHILIVGGGKVAYRKLVYLLDFTHNIKIIAKELSKDLKEVAKKYSLEYQLKEYHTADIKGFDFVIVATNCKLLQKQIYLEAKQYNRCFVNSVDHKQYCDFIFPACIKKENLTITVSTNGISPAFAKQFLDYLKRFIPDDTTEFLNKLYSLRQRLPKGNGRMKLLSQEVKTYIDKKKAPYLKDMMLYKKE